MPQLDKFIGTVQTLTLLSINSFSQQPSVEIPKTITIKNLLLNFY